MRKPHYDTHKAPTVQTWLDNHPRFHMHYTPTYSSWINQVERWFAELTRQLLERGDHRSVQALEKDIRAWIAAWNDNPNRVSPLGWWGLGAGVGRGGPAGVCRYRRWGGPSRSGQ